ncbi:MAG TPA: tetratricopeptide repeat protein [Gammaproteobacteria bacterium]|nr:tetratricopeptide repeat protein [Gammaproteobacteria bacterium]
MRCLIGHRARSVAVWLLLGLPVAGPAQEPPEDAPGGELVEVPHPDLSGLKAEIRETLKPAVEYFGSREKTLSGQALGQLYGWLGLHYFAHEQQDAAEACFLNATTLDSGNFRWPHYLAVHYDETGDHRRAAASYTYSLSLNPANPPARIRLGLVALELERPDKAEEQFELVLGAEENNAAALAGMGRLALQRNEPRAAIDYFERALDAQPEADQLHYQIALAYRELGEVDPAEEHLARRGERAPQIADPLLIFMQAFLQGPEAFIERGDEALKAGNPDEAARVFGVAAAVAPADIDARLRLAQTLAALGRSAEAHGHLEQALEIDPLHGAANYLKATQLEHAGQEKLAIGHYRAAANADAADLVSRARLGILLIRDGKYAQAAEALRKVVATEKAGADAWYFLGLAELAQGRCDEGGAALESAVRLSPSDPRALQSLSRVYSTCGSATEEQQAQSLLVAEELYQRYPGRHTSATLAMAMAANDRYEDAVELQTQAIFEAIKAEDEEGQRELYADMQRYQKGEPARRAWPEDSPIFMPPRLGAGQAQAQVAE